MSSQLHECCVCLEENVRVIDRTACRHYVCRDCISKLPRPICPMCRAPLNKSTAPIQNPPPTHRIDSYVSYFAPDGTYVASHWLRSLMQSDKSVQDKRWQILTAEPEVPPYLNNRGSEFIANFKLEWRPKYDAEMAYMLQCGYVPQ
jgi:hypothetical protein